MPAAGAQAHKDIGPPVDTQASEQETGRTAMGKARRRADGSKVGPPLMEAWLPSMLINRLSWPIAQPAGHPGTWARQETGHGCGGGEAHLRPLREKGPTAARASRSTAQAKARAGASSQVQLPNPRSRGSRVKSTPCACSASANTWHTPAGGRGAVREKHVSLPGSTSHPTWARSPLPGITNLGARARAGARPREWVSCPVIPGSGSAGPPALPAPGK